MIRTVDRANQKKIIVQRKTSRYIFGFCARSVQGWGQGPGQFHVKDVIETSGVRRRLFAIGDWNYPWTFSVTVMPTTGGHVAFVPYTKTSITSTRRYLTEADAASDLARLQAIRSDWKAYQPYLAYLQSKWAKPPYER